MAISLRRAAMKIPRINGASILSSRSFSSNSDAIVELRTGETGMVSGIPDEHLNRRVVIHSPARSASQQGAGKVGRRKINFLSTQKWENPLMGWTSTGEAAKAFAGKHGYVGTFGSRMLSTTILTPDSSEGPIPSELLKPKKVVLAPDHTRGLYQDLVIPMTNFHFEDKGFFTLPGDVFDVPLRKDIIHKVVRWQLAKRQQGTHSTKTISEVSGTGKKPYQQKGTGRARHGTLRGPQFRGGCVMHGPKPRSHAIKCNKKIRRLGLKVALSARAAEGKLLIFDTLELPNHKTKNIVSWFEQLENTKKILLVGDTISDKLKLATQNVHYVNVLPSVGLNVYSILWHDTMVMSRDAVNRIVERMHTPIKR